MYPGRYRPRTEFWIRHLSPPSQGSSLASCKPTQRSDDRRVDDSGWNRCWFSSCDEVSNKSSAGVIPLVTTVEINMAEFVKNSAQKRSLKIIGVLKVLRGELFEVTVGGLRHCSTFCCGDSRIAITTKRVAVDTCCHSPQPDRTHPTNADVDVLPAVTPRSG